MDETERERAERLYAAYRESMAENVLIHKLTHLEFERLMRKYRPLWAPKEAMDHARDELLTTGRVPGLLSFEEWSARREKANAAG